MKSKKQSKNIFSKISLNSRKSKLILIVAIFILIGGSVLVYKSFAASVDGGFPSCSRIAYPDTCTTVIDPVIGQTSTKNGSTINAAYEITAKSGHITIPFSFPYGAKVAPGQSYRACASVRPMKNTVMYIYDGVLKYDSAGNPFPTPASWSLPQLSSYRTYCSNYYKNTTGVTYDAGGNIVIDKYSQIRIKAAVGTGAWVEVIDPTPTGTTSKNP